MVARSTVRARKDTGKRKKNAIAHAHDNELEQY